MTTLLLLGGIVTTLVTPGITVVTPEGPPDIVVVTILGLGVAAGLVPLAGIVMMLVPPG